MLSRQVWQRVSIRETRAVSEEVFLRWAEEDDRPEAEFGGDPLSNRFCSRDRCPRAQRSRLVRQNNS